MNKKVLDKFENNVWYFEDYDLANDRVNKSSAVKSICFDSVLIDKKNWALIELKNKHNIILLKKLMGHFISNTNHSVSTVSCRLSGLKIFLYYINDIDIENVTRDIVLGYYDFLKSRGVGNSTFNSRVSELNSFLDYLQRERIIDQNYTFRATDRVKHVREHVCKTISDVTINQIYSILDKIPINFSIMFLILHSTGMRVSEVCQLEKGKTKKLDDGYFIEYFSVKMKKEVTNPISANLYKLIIEYEKKLNNNEKYLFSRELNMPMHAVTFADKFNDLIDPYNIRDENNNSYRFKPHDYRHTLATKMAKRNIPPTVIQTILHHESESMTYEYIDITSKDRIESFKKFVNYKGLVLNSNTDTVKAEWLRENINTQILPNGLCSLPIKLSKCPHINSCLTCEYFYTSIEFIDVHRKQIEKTEQLIVISENNNWNHQINTNKKSLEHLINIVKILESE